MAAVLETGAGNGELENDDYWAVLAHKHWPKPVNTKRVKPDVIKTEIWDVLEEDGFSLRSLCQLESLQLLEKCVITNRIIVSPSLIEHQLLVAWL